MKNGNAGEEEKGGLVELLTMKLKALLDIESELVKALPKMAKKANDESLAKGFEKHAEQTKNHEARVKQALEMLEAKPQKIKAESIRGLVEDADWLMKNAKGDEMRDAGMAAAAQGVEHFEIAEYESAIEWAQLLGKNDVADLLSQTLQEEKETSEELAQLAETKLNERAMSGAAAR